MGGGGWLAKCIQEKSCKRKVDGKKTHTCGVLTQKTYSCTKLKNNATCRYTQVNV